MASERQPASTETCNPRQQTEQAEQPATTTGGSSTNGNESYIDTVKQHISTVAESVSSQAAPGETIKNLGARVREAASGMAKKGETEIESLDPAERERIDNAEKEKIEEFLKEKHKSTDGVMARVK